MTRGDRRRRPQRPAADAAPLPARRRPACVVTLLLLVLAPRAHAVEVIAADAWSDGAMYYIGAEVLIDAPRARVHALLTDFDHLGRIHDAIVRSRAETAPDGVLRVTIDANDCVLWFCVATHRVERVELIGESTIVTRIEPGSGDFLFGQTYWRLFDEPPRRTRLRLHSVIHPAFRIPPLIGGWLFRRALVEKTLAAAMRLEALGGAPDPRAQDADAR